MNLKRWETVKDDVWRKRLASHADLSWQWCHHPESSAHLQEVLNAIQTTYREEEHFWYYRDDILSEICQKTGEPLHFLSIWLTQLINNCKFTNNHTKGTLKIYYYNKQSNTMKPRTRAISRTKPPSPTTASSHIVSHWKSLWAVPRSTEKGCNKSTTITAAISTSSSIY